MALLKYLIPFYLLINHLYAIDNIYKKSAVTIKLKNPHFDNLTHYINKEFHQYNINDSHTNDNTGSVEIIGHHWTKALTSSPFLCTKNTKYLLSAYMKVSQFPKGQNIVLSITPGNHEIYWNASKANTWEKIILPFIPQKTQKYQFRVFTFSHSFSTIMAPEIINNKAFAHKPTKVKKDGSNLDRSSKVFIDDFQLVELNNINKEKITSKVPFKSSHIQIDTLGNFSIKNKTNKWIAIFPKLIYKNDTDQYQEYVKYGFNGIMDIWTKKQMEKGIKAGLKYFAMASQPANRLEGSLGKRIKELINYTNKIQKPYALLMYTIDNENISLQEDNYHKQFAKFLDIYDKDNQTLSRARPIYYLNGNYGLARAYKNDFCNYMDITGSYVGSDSNGEIDNTPPIPTLDIMNRSENQITPVSVIQLQSYFNEYLIPSLFYGLIQGGKAVSIWRDGSRQGAFQNNIWALKIKDVFQKVDQILPILREPRPTNWSARIIQKDPNVNIGIFTHNKHSYLIVSNHNSTDKQLTIEIKNIQLTSLIDYYTKKKVSSLSSNKNFTLTLGHGNNGYKVLELVK